jgi:hypothetical protein
MPSASPSENPFLLIRNKFEGGYQAGWVAAAPDGQEFIGGRMADDGEIGIFRLGIDLLDGKTETFRIQTAPAIPEMDIPEMNIHEEDEIDDIEIGEGVREYLVGGSELAPIGCEVIGTDPFETRLLAPAELAELTRKISGTAFRSLVTPIP